MTIKRDKPIKGSGTYEREVEQYKSSKALIINSIILLIFSILYYLIVTPITQKSNYILYSAIFVFLVGGCFLYWGISDLMKVQKQVPNIKELIALFKKHEDEDLERKEKEAEQEQSLLEEDALEKAVPEEIKKQLTKMEKVSFFTYITNEGGCIGSSPRKEYYIAITNKKVMYRKKIREGKDTIEKHGILPLEKISFVEVTNVEEGGCSGGSYYQLEISTSGGTIKIPMPTKELAYESRDKLELCRKPQ